MDATRISLYLTKYSEASGGAKAGRESEQQARL